MNRFKKALSEFLTSKKAWALLASNGGIQAMDLPPKEQAIGLVLTTIGYLISQGIADQGKSKMSVKDFATAVSAEVNKNWATESRRIRAEWEAEQQKQ